MTNNLGDLLMILLYASGFFTFLAAVVWIFQEIEARNRRRIRRFFGGEK